MMDSDEPPSTPLDALKVHYSKFHRQYQQTLDRWTPHMVNRWLGTTALLSLFLLRIVLAQGWYIVCYGHAIYLLNLLLAFLQPKFDPSLQEDLLADEIEEGGPGSGSAGGGDLGGLGSPGGMLGGGMGIGEQSGDDEFRPFVRRLPEWQFWLSSTRATIIALLCTTSEIFDVPVYWPILVCYFFVLFALTMRRQIQHMIKYKYIPFDIGRKARYGNGHAK